MILYAIKEKITGEYYTKYGQLDKLGNYTELYTTKEAANRAINGSITDLGTNYRVVKYNIYRTLLDRKLIDCCPTLYEALDFADLEVVEIRLNEVKHKNAK